MSARLTRALPPELLADFRAIPAAACMGPDAKLLEVAHEAIEVHVREEKLFAASNEMLMHSLRHPGETDREALDANSAERKELWERSRPLLRLCGKLPATTPAGVLAKALLLEKTGGAKALALSLAKDLRTNPAPRRAIWPVEQVI